MIHASYLRLGILVLLALPVYCDTVTTTDNLSVHGTIEEVTPTAITLESKFASGLKPYTVSRDKVMRIDINSIIFNPGAPPKTLGLAPGRDETDNAKPEVSQKDTIVLKGNRHKSCKLLAIDASMIRCEEGEYSRTMVLYILVGRSQ